MARALLPTEPLATTRVSVPTIILFPWSLERGSPSDAVVRTLLRRRGTARAFPVRDNDPLPILLRMWSAAVFVVVTNADMRVRMRRQMVETFSTQGGRYQEMIMHALEDDARDLVDQVAAAQRFIGQRLPGMTGT